MTKEEYIILLEKCEKEDAMDLVYYLVGSLLSSDTMIDIESCERSIREFTAILEALKEASVSDTHRSQLVEIAETGIRVGEQGRAIFAGEGIDER